MTVIKITYEQVAPVIKITYDVNEVFVGGQTSTPVYVSVDYASSVASGNVSSVALSMPTGFNVSGSPITTAGTFIVSVANGYVIPTQAMFDAKVPYSGATGNVDLGEYEIKAGQLELDQTPTGAAGVAVTRWNDTVGTIETTLKGGNVVLKHGRDMFERVVNKTGIQLTKAAYQAVRVSDAQGQRLAVQLAQANNDNNSADTIGLVVETIDNNQEGIIYTVGELTGINTTGSLQGETWVDGDVLYLSPTTAGRITNVKPYAPQHLVVIGYVVYAHQNNGKIYIKIMNGWELGELHDVDTRGATNGQVLTYDSATGVWKPATNGSGTITGSGTSQYIPKFTGASSIGNSNIVLSSGGDYVTTTIGSTSGAQNNYNTLDLQAVTESRVFLRSSNNDRLTAFNSFGSCGLLYEPTTTGNYLIYYTGGTTKKLTIQTNAVDRITIDNAGVIKLNAYTTNGIVKTINGDGTLSIDTTSYQPSLSLTTTGTSGAATLIGSTLNIPQYQAAGSYVSTSRTLTINDVAFDLSADRSWSVGDYGTW